MTDKDTPFERFRLAGASVHQLRMLETALKQAPELNERVTRAMREDDLTRIDVLNPDGNLGQYSGLNREIGFKPKLLNERINQRGIDGMVDVFSHEIEHALRRKEMRTFDTAFEQQAYALAEQPGPRDATALVQEYIDKGSQQETLAELAGINGLADRMRAEGEESITESKLARRLMPTSSCVEKASNGGFKFKEGIHFDPETQSVPVTAENLKAVGKHFFDIDRGHNDYKAFYASAAVSAIARGDAAQQVDNPLRPTAQTRINLAALGVDAEDLRRQDFDFGVNPPGPFAFTDSSPGRNRVLEVADTAGRKTPGAPEMALDPTSPAHPDHDTFNVLRNGVVTDGRWTPDQSDNIAAALLLESREHPTMQRVDAMALSESGRGGVVRAFAMYKPHGDRDPIFHASVEADKAAQVPAQDSFVQLQVVDQNLAMSQQREQAQKQEQERQRTQGPDGTPQPPVMKH